MSFPSVSTALAVGVWLISHNTSIETRSPSKKASKSEWEGVGGSGREWEGVGGSGREWEGVGGSGRQWEG